MILAGVNIQQNPARRVQRAKSNSESLDRPNLKGKTVCPRGIERSKASVGVGSVLHCRYTRRRESSGQISLAYIINTATPNHPLIYVIFIL